MKYRILGAVLTVMLLSSPATLANRKRDRDVAPASFQIAYIDLEEVFSSRVVAQKLESLNTEFESRKNDFEAAKNRLNTMQEEFDKESAAMTKIVRENREQEIREMANNLSRQGSEMQGEYYSRQQEIKTEFYNKVMEISESIARKYKIQAVFPKQALLYADKEFDLTEELLRQLA